LPRPSCPSSPLPWARLISAPSRYPCAPALSLCVCVCRGAALSASPSPRPPWTSTRALAHARQDPRPHRPPTHPQLLFEHRPRPHSLPRPISHSLALSLALCPRCSTSPETHARLDNRPAHRKPRQATPRFPRGEAPVPKLGFPNCASLLANFSFAGGWLWRSAAPARWPAKLSRSSAPAPAPSIPLALLKIIQALEHLSPLSAARISHRSYPDPPGVLSQPFSPL
jgi:hypothetical protein